LKLKFGRRVKPAAVGVILVAVAGLLAACSSGSPGSTTTTTSSAKGLCPYTFAVITHGDNGEFWSGVYKGARDAAKDYGCKLSEVYGSQQQGQAEPDDNAENAQIQNAINEKVNGIVVTDHDPSLMNQTLARAAAAGIPVVLTNTGCDPADITASKAITCTGQPEQLAGQEAGKRFLAQGHSNVLCVIHQSGQNLLDRCNGIAQGLGVGSTCKTGNAPAGGPACTELVLSTPNAASNPQQAVGQVTAYLQAHPGVNAVMTLNNAVGDAVVQTHPGSNIKIATFDLDSNVLNDVQNGGMDFIVDQQQYLQGYVPIVTLYLYNKHHGASLGIGNSIVTGPLLVDSSNIAKVEAAVAAGDA
jgi:simple sugar transport system substrate-binding protein